MGEIGWEIVASLHDNQAYHVTYFHADIFQGRTELFLGALADGGGVRQFLGGTEKRFLRRETSRAK